MTIQLEQDYLTQVKKHSEDLERKYRNVLKTDSSLTRRIVSFQANKQEPIYRWYKYKEAFSAKLVEWIFNHYSVGFGTVLDPFAGVGTTLFAACNRGNDTVGIELLPIGQEIIKTRQYLENREINSILPLLRKWRDNCPWKNAKGTVDFNIIRITNGAYPIDTETEIKKFLWSINQLQNDTGKQLLRFVLLCVLESISFTRKDGQYLRWDFRSGRRNGENDFNKGYIKNFEEAIKGKLDEVIIDLSQAGHQMELFKIRATHQKGKSFLIKGSCLDELPKMKENIFSSVVTSPPYCNRYDYTRTYALELAILGVTEAELKFLRQTMLSCTVENKEKDLCSINDEWVNVIDYVKKHNLLSAIIEYLEEMRNKDSLNNDGIIRMVKGYFYELACIIYECHRVLKKNGLMVMVNDNVRYAGISIPVDLILSDFAKFIGFTVKQILVLSHGKGNSSQQMGEHGRQPLRKCVYIWSKDC